MKLIYLFAQISTWGLLLGNSAEIYVEQMPKGLLEVSEPKIRYVDLQDREIAQESQAIASSCPRDVEALVAWMLQDLPSYANRVIQRSRSVGKSQKPNLSVFIAGKPEFQPLTLGAGEYYPRELREKEEPRQVFFTTWDRAYKERQISEFQSYYWAFFTYTSSGWRLAALYSSLGSYPATKPPTPIRESSEGFIGQGIKLWLRDCAVGKLRSRSPRPAELRRSGV